MKKVKIIAKEKYPFLEEAINDFIKDKTVLDIQYADTPTFVSALIVYEDVGEEISALTGMSSTEASEPKYETVSVKI